MERSENLGFAVQKRRNPERVRRAANPFRVLVFFISFTQGCRYAPTAGLKLANAFGVYRTVIIKIIQTLSLG
jgi:hypothetical protein